MTAILRETDDNLGLSSEAHPPRTALYESFDVSQHHQDHRLASVVE